MTPLPAAAPPAAPSEDALEAAFTKAVNAPSASGRGIAVPHYRDVERIWAAIRAAAGDGGLDVERLARAMTEAAPSRPGIHAEAEAVAFEYMRIWRERVPPALPPADPRLLG